MEKPLEKTATNPVSPLELFFDLVFVFAISQLSNHLLENLHWRGLAETAVILTGVFGVWSYTSFEVTITHGKRQHVQRVMLLVMVLSLYMNAAIDGAFADSPWTFVAPMLAIQIGRTALSSIPTAPTQLLRKHYTVVLYWMLLSMPLWVIGAVLPSGARLGWWAAAAALDLAGTWSAHPWPGRRLESDHVEFDAEHMLERLRLFMIIALGEVILLTGTAVTAGHMTPGSVVASLFALAIIVCLWALYFNGSDHFINRHIDRTTNPILATRLAMNGQAVVVGGLIALAVANQLAISHPDEHYSMLPAILLSGGTIAYLFVQTWFLYFVTGRFSTSRIIAIVVIVAIGAAAPYIPALATLGVLASILGVLWGVVARQNKHGDECLL